MLERNDSPRPLTLVLILLAILGALAFAGGGDYADAVERENRVLRAAAARCQLAERLREAPQVGVERVDYSLASREVRP